MKPGVFDAGKSAREAFQAGLRTGKMMGAFDAREHLRALNDCLDASRLKAHEAAERAGYQSCRETHPTLILVWACYGVLVGVVGTLTCQYLWS